MKHFRIFLVMLVALGLVSPAYAADIYKDRYTTESSTGNWTMTGTVASKTPTEIVTTPSATTSTVTSAKSGYTFIVTGSAGTVGGAGWTFTLPTAAAGLEYTFISATNQAVSVRGASATDIIIYGGYVNNARATSPASTGCTLTVVGGTSRWYVKEMDVPAGPANTKQNWVGGSF